MKSTCTSQSPNSKRLTSSLGFVPPTLVSTSGGSGGLGGSSLGGGSSPGLGGSGGLGATSTSLVGSLGSSFTSLCVQPSCFHAFRASPSHRNRMPAPEPSRS